VRGDQLPPAKSYSQNPEHAAGRRRLVGRPPRPSFRSIRAGDIDHALVIEAADAHSPGVAADLAVLNERAAHVWFHVNLDVLSAIRALHGEYVHVTIMTQSLTRIYVSQYVD